MKLTRNGFKAWLEQRRTVVVARSDYEGGSCPLARFLRARGASDPWVCSDEFTLDNLAHATNWRPLPAWAKRFVRAVDNPDTRKPITARRALDILEQCK